MKKLSEYVEGNCRDPNVVTIVAVSDERMNGFCMCCV